MTEAIGENDRFLAVPVSPLGLTNAQINAMQQVHELTRQHNLVMRSVLELLDRRAD